MVFCSDDDYGSRKAVVAAHSDAAVIRRVCGGWMVFATIADYETWRKQV